LKNRKEILLVDDEAKIVEVIQTYLENAGYKVYCAYDGNEAMRIFESHNLDLIVLDLMLPDISGEEICRMIRKKSRVPIIMLTAKSSEEDMVGGFEIGADDYVTKPFTNRTLLARIGALLRRASDEAVPIVSILTYNDDDLVIDSLRQEVRKNGAPVALTPNERNILLTLVKYPAKAFTREELIEFAFGDDFDGYDRVVDTHIKNLRHKIENDTKNPVYILTVNGIGYRFGGDEG
jgi:DNA-binding response OmpR family regulator